mmetsp:Transcript_14483/g.25372  ORF Transcript_14483/g.25372 Transcript_14483/m.25372 type:complete len:294 (-) Transcript_14483:293-1174(-)
MSGCEASTCATAASVASNVTASGERDGLSPGLAGLCRFWRESGCVSVASGVPGQVSARGVVRQPCGPLAASSTEETAESCATAQASTSTREKEPGPAVSARTGSISDIFMTSSVNRSIRSFGDGVRVCVCVCVCVRARARARARVYDQNRRTTSHHEHHRRADLPSGQAVRQSPKSPLHASRAKATGRLSQMNAWRAPAALSGHHQRCHLLAALRRACPRHLLRLSGLSLPWHPSRRVARSTLRPRRVSRASQKATCMPSQLARFPLHVCHRRRCCRRWCLSCVHVVGHRCLV